MRLPSFLIPFLLLPGAMAQVPIVLRSHTPAITIQDGAERRSGYWSLDPDARPDVYVADRTRASKAVRFIADADSLVFELKPGDVFDFVILLNDTDSCFTQLRSAIRAEDLRYMPPPVRAVPDTIPFVLTAKNNILLTAVIDAQDTLRLMFHTGMRGLDITEDARARMHSFHTDAKVTSSSWGGGGASDLSAHHALRIGWRSWNDVELATSSLSGEGSDGKLGYDFFADQVLEVDFDRCRIVVHDRLPEATTGYAALPIHYQRGSFFITCRVNSASDTFDQAFMVHTGHSGALIFGTRAVNEAPSLDELRSEGAEVLKDSFGHELRNEKVRLPSLVIAQHDLVDVPASLMDPRSSIPASVIGGEVLKRFNWLLDLRNDVMYLRPNSRYGSPFP